jgi:hypothetical protein
MGAHAFLSPSGAPAWLRCHAKPWREADVPDSSSDAADEGTAAHFLRDEALRAGRDTSIYFDLTIAVTPQGAVWEDTENPSGFSTFKVDAEMVAEVQKSIDGVRAAAQGGTLYPEQQLAIAFITGEKDATGQADAIIVKPTELAVDDLKYGRGVPVDAEENEQLLIYGAAALDEYDVLGEIETLRMRISQPRLNNDSEWVLPVADVRRRVIEIRAVADKIMAGPEGLTATPGDKQCRFCKVKATCEEYRAHVLGTVAGEFVDLTKGELAVSVIEAEKVLAQAYGVKPKDITFEDGRFIVNKPSIRPQLEAAQERIASLDDQHLATLMDSVDMLEGLAKAVRADVERRLLAGTFSDARYKLVEGKKGARGWRDEAEAEAALKAMRLKVDQMYDLKVISPTSAEKLLAAANPRKWKKLQDHITQSQGKPSVAPASDKRPALDMAVKFEPLPALEEELL